MNEAARHVMKDLRPEVILAFGESDEYSFLLRKSCFLYKRRQSKIVTHIVSLFTSAYVFYWNHFFPQKQLLYPPSFDGRLVVYPSDKEVQDYFAWRQVDTHINNLYNTTFWALVHGGQSEREAHETLKGTVSAQKNELLYQRFNVNYDKLDALFRKGTTLAWNNRPQKDNGEKKRKIELKTLHVDIIGTAFWKQDAGIEHRKEVTLEVDSSQQIWQHLSRLGDSAGLGRIALDA